MRSQIALNALALRPGGSGVQTYIRELLHALAARDQVKLIAAVQADAVGELPDGVTPLTRPVAAGVRRALEGLRGLDGADLVHGLDVDLPLRLGAPAVTTVHDLSAFDAPYAFTRGRLAGERLLLRHAIRRADLVIADSNFIAERLAARFGRDAVVVPLAPSPEMRPAPAHAVRAAGEHHGLPDRFVLQVATVEPRKDVHALARACATAGVPLVLTGAVTPGNMVPAGARSLGWVDRRELPALYGAATLVAYASRYEGFGLPPVEAMACRAPVVATRVGALPEVVGDAFELVPVGDERRLARALRELLEDHERRAEVAERGYRRASELSWRRTAAETAAAYGRLGVAA